LSSYGFTQKTLKIYFQPNQPFSYQTKFPDSLKREAYYNLFLGSLQKKGYWYTSITKKQYTKDLLTLEIKLGEPLLWQKLEQGNLESNFINESSLENFINIPFDYEQWENFSELILKKAENKGYPFAKIQLDSIQITDNKVSAKINFQKGFYVTWDTLSIQGSLKLKRSFLEKYLQIHKDEPYSQATLQKAERLLKNLGFVKIIKPTKVLFETQRAKPIFYANQNQSNEIDAILGIMPNELSPSSLLLTGQAQIRLRNLFNAAKSLEIEFQQLKPRHQLLNAFYKHPILFSSKLNFEFDFKLLKEDTNFVNINRMLRFTYPLNSQTNFKLFGGIQSSQTGFTPNASINKLPANQENKYTFYGLGYEMNTLDNLFLPKRGLQLEIGVQTGNKIIEKLPFLNDSLYKNIQLNSIQTAVFFKQNFYTMFSSKNGLFAKLDGGYLINKNLLQSELYRLGGLLSIRGFNQNFFFASAYLLATLEYRFFWEEEAFFSLFYDQAIFESKILNIQTKDAPFGIGAGISFKTKGGIFNLSYALGNSQTQKMSIAKSKIHFGFISRF